MPSKVSNSKPVLAVPVMKPMRDDVLVEILDVPVSEWLIVPDAYKDTPVRGKVLATGPGRRASTGKVIPCDVEPGEVIQFHFGAILAYYPDRQHALIEGVAIQAVLG